MHDAHKHTFWNNIAHFSTSVFIFMTLIMPSSSYSHLISYYFFFCFGSHSLALVPAVHPFTICMPSARARSIPQASFCDPWPSKQLGKLEAIWCRRSCKHTTWITRDNSVGLDKISRGGGMGSGFLGGWAVAGSDEVSDLIATPLATASNAAARLRAAAIYSGRIEPQALQI